MENLDKRSADQSLRTRGLKHNICKGIVAKTPINPYGYILDYTLELSDLAHPHSPPLSFCLSDTLILNTLLACYHYLMLASALSLATAGSYIKRKKKIRRNYEITSF